MNSENKNNNVVIDLSNYTTDNTTLTSRNEIIHLEQLDEVCSIIKEKIEFARDYNPNKPNGFISLNDVISILARRGAGKTTFVKSLVHLIRTSSEDTFKNLREDLYCVDVFEPNQMMNKENLLIRFLAQINEIFQEKKCCNQDDKDNQVRLKNARRKLYEALPVIDGVGKSNLFPDWDDNAYIADRYMNLASNVKDLEKRFHHYIHTGLDVIGKKAILFVLDDSDVNIEKSFEILELIRLFFTSPQIIVVLTGDASLYSMVVRRNYWQYFTKAFLEKECDALDKSCTKFREYQKMVYRLEAQYLQKMIKANHRIFLNNVYDKIHLNNLKEKEEQTEIRIKTVSGEKEIRKLYQELFEKLDVHKKLFSIQDTYINHFLAQPFRNQLRLFTIYDNYLKQNKKNPEIFTKGLLKVFEVYINQLSGDSKYLMAHSPIYPAWLLKFLVENNILNIGSSFLPEMESDSLKNAVSVLGLSCYEQIKHNPSIIFDFWIRISLTKQLSVFLGEDIITKTENNLIKYAQLYSDNGLDNVLGNMLTYSKNILANNEAIQITIPGALIRKGICCNPDKESYIEVKLINLLQIESVSIEQKTCFTYSLYRPLAVLGDLLRLTSSYKDFNALDNLFEQLSHVKLYVEPNVNISVKSTPFFAKKNITKDLEIIYEDRTESFLKRMQQWSYLKNELQAAPYFINRIFSRYFDFMIDYSNNLKDENCLLGDFINDATLAFWNAAISEMLFLKNQKVATLQDNDNGVLNVFLKNYNKIHQLGWFKIKDSLFIVWLLNCPLLNAYIDPFIQELMRMIREEKLNNSTVWGLIRKHRFHSKQKIFNEKLTNLEFETRKVISDISNYEEYMKTYNKILSIDNNIKIYEVQLGSENYSLKQKKNFQKEISKLMDEKHTLKTELLKMGLSFNKYTPEEKLEQLYKELHELEDEKLLAELHIDAKLTPNNNIYNELYNEIEAKSADIISVYPILNNL